MLFDVSCIEFPPIVFCSVDWQVIRSLYTIGVFFSTHRLNREVSVTETRKEDDLYFQGVFWIIADSVVDIYNDQFEIVSEKFLTDYDGKLQTDFNQKFWTHRDIWDKKFKSKYQQEFNYFPRGRVVIKNGKAWINIPREMYLPQIRDSVVSEFELSKLEEVFDAIKPDSLGNHYNFLLK